MPEDVSLEVKNLKIENDKFKISNVSFVLKSGDILGIVGRSGEGKSTILTSILGFQKYKTGSIIIKSHGNAVKINEIVGYSPQDNALFPFLTVEENIFVFGNLNRMKSSDIKKRMNGLLKKLDIENARKKRIVQLSGGMRKRADLAVSLIQDPKIIVLDEPFNGLDISLQKFLWDILKELAKEGRIIIVSSHLLHDVERHCNQFGLVSNGTYYDTDQIKSTIRSNGEKSFEQFFEKLFSGKIELKGRKDD